MTFSSLLRGAVLTLIAVSLSFHAAEADVPVKAAMLVNTHTGLVLYQKSPDMRIPPASLTKLMTGMLTLDALDRGKIGLNTRVSVHSNAACVGGSSMCLCRGEKISVDSLLKGMMVVSGNDAATTLANKLGGSIPNFVHMMNARARSLYMRSTTFRNPSGLPATGQLTTARDITRLSMAYISTHPSALRRYHSLPGIQHRKRYLSATNPFLGEPGVDGLKTGYTRASGYNIVVTKRVGDTRLLVVVLGAKTKGARTRAVRSLLDAGFQYPSNPKAVSLKVDGLRKRSPHGNIQQNPSQLRQKRLYKKLYQKPRLRCVTPDKAKKRG